MKLESWAHWAEIAASTAVVVSLVFLTLEIRDNTRALEGQAVRERAAALNQAYVESPLAPSILAKIKGVDGPEPAEALLIERYGLTYEEAGIWARRLADVWTGLEAEFIRDGQSQGLQDRVQLLLLYPDVQVFWDSGAIQIQDAGFRQYVWRLRESPSSEWVRDYDDQLDALRDR